jgi:hypothetical protein
VQEGRAFITATSEHLSGARSTSAEEIPDTVVPQSINPLGNYAVQISWEDGFNQVCVGGGPGGGTCMQAGTATACIQVFADIMMWLTKMSLLVRD